MPDVEAHEQHGNNSEWGDFALKVAGSIMVLLLGVLGAVVKYEIGTVMTTVSAIAEKQNAAAIQEQKIEDRLDYLWNMAGFGRIAHTPPTGDTTRPPVAASSLGAAEK